MQDALSQETLPCEDIGKAAHKLLPIASMIQMESLELVQALAPEHINEVETEKSENISLPSSMNCEISSENYHQGLFLEYASDEKPGMSQQGGQQTIMVFHHLKAFFQGILMILHRHSTIQIIGDDCPYVTQRQLMGFGCFHHADAPINIGRKAVIQIIVLTLGNIRAGIKD